MEYEQIMQQQMELDKQEPEPKSNFNVEDEIDEYKVALLTENDEQVTPANQRQELFKTHSVYRVYNTDFIVPKRYTLIRCIGNGAFGVVCAAEDKQTGEKVAIKRISRAFDNLRDTKRTLREIHLLKHFNHENILSIKDIFKPISKENFEDIYIVTELMDTDLFQIIQSPQDLSDDHAQYFLYQILRGLKTLHSADVLHRDLKPGNLLINGDCLLKICDLGLARVACNPGMGCLSEYVATRWYRAPEIILSWNIYNKAIDIWSVGCIFAEILGRKPFFQGKDYLNQIYLIITMLGKPSEEDILKIPLSAAQDFVRSIPDCPRISFTQMFPKASPMAIDLLEKMLVFNPEKRITVEQAIAHPYLESLHDPSDEPICLEKVNLNFESWELKNEILKDLIYNEILLFHPETNPQQQQQQQQNNQLFHLLQQQQKDLIEQQRAQQIQQQYQQQYQQQQHQLQQLEQQLQQQQQINHHQQHQQQQQQQQQYQQQQQQLHNQQLHHQH